MSSRRRVDPPGNPAVFIKTLCNMQTYTDSERGAFGLARFIEGLVFGVSATDPATFAGVAGFILLVALGASCVPAWRAARIDPADALRAV